MPPNSASVLGYIGFQAMLMHLWEILFCRTEGGGGLAAFEFGTSIPLYPWKNSMEGRWTLYCLHQFLLEKLGLNFTKT